MKCERCEQSFIGKQCACGWHVPALSTQSTYILRACPNNYFCNAWIRERINTPGPAVCKWCQRADQQEDHTEEISAGIDMLKARRQKQLTEQDA